MLKTILKKQKKRKTKPKTNKQVKETAQAHCAVIDKLFPLGVGVNASDTSIHVYWNWTIKQKDGG